MDLAGARMITDALGRDRRVRDSNISVLPDANPGEGILFAALLAMAGHDLRQPLQLITSAHEMLARLVDGDEQRRQLIQAEKATAQFAGILDQIVEAVDFHERWSKQPHVAVGLGPILDSIAQEFAPPAQQKGIRFRVVSAQGTVISHPVLLLGMLRNLVRNAIEYTPSGGSVLVGCRRLGAKLRIEVRDSGPGIKAGAVPKIFGAFQRLDTTRPDGLGLGLFIVKRAADVLGHRIDVQSVAGCGSCFSIVARTAECRRSGTKGSTCGSPKLSRSHADQVTELARKVALVGKSCRECYL